MRESTIHINVLSDKRDRVHRHVIDLVMKQVVEISRGELVFALKELLLKSGFESAKPFRPQSRVGLSIRRPSEGLLQPRFFESAAVRKTQTRARKMFSPTQGLPGQRNPWHSSVPEFAVVNQAASNNRAERL